MLPYTFLLQDAASLYSVSRSGYDGGMEDEHDTSEVVVETWLYCTRLLLSTVLCILQSLHHSSSSSLFIIHHRSNTRLPRYQD